jgi:competence protein ComEA
MITGPFLEDGHVMLATRLLATAALIGLAAAPVLAQTTSPATPSRPAVTSPVAQQPPSTTVPGTTATHPATSAPAGATSAAKKTNLNTATAEELDALPDLGKARSKAILDERAKGKFKDWADFDKRMSGTSVNAGVKAKMQDQVTF